MTSSSVNFFLNIRKIEVTTMTYDFISAYEYNHKINNKCNSINIKLMKITNVLLLLIIEWTMYETQFSDNFGVKVIYNSSGSKQCKLFSISS